MVMAQTTTQNRPTLLRRSCKCLKRMAGTTGLEPAASAVTGQRSNQLNYVPTCSQRIVGNPRKSLCSRGEWTTQNTNRIVSECSCCERPRPAHQTLWEIDDTNFRVTMTANARVTSDANSSARCGYDSIL